MTERRRSSLRGGSRRQELPLVDEKGTSDRLYSILTKDAGPGEASPPKGGGSSSAKEAGDEKGSSSAQTTEGVGDRPGGGYISPRGDPEAEGEPGRRRSKQQAADRRRSKQQPAEQQAPEASQEVAQAAGGEVSADSGAGGGLRPAAQSAVALRRLSSTASLPAEVEEVPPTPEVERVERDREAFVNTIVTEESHPDLKRMIRRLYIAGLLTWPEKEKPVKEKRSPGGKTIFNAGDAAVEKSRSKDLSGEEDKPGSPRTGQEDGGAGGDQANGTSEDGNAQTSNGSIAGGGMGARSLDVQVPDSDASALFDFSSPSSRLGGQGAENEEARLKRYLATCTKEQDAWVKKKVSEMVSRVHRAVDRRVEQEGWNLFQSRGVLDDEANRLRLKNVKRQKLRKELDKHMNSYLKHARLEAMKEWEDRQARGIKNVEVEEKEGETDMVFRTLTKPTIANDLKKRAGQVPKFPPLKMTYSLPVDWKQRSAAFALT